MGVPWGVLGLQNYLQKTVQGARGGFSGNIWGVLGSFWGYKFLAKNNTGCTSWLLGVHWDLFWVRHGPRVVSDVSRHARDGLRQVRHLPRNLQGGPRRLSEGPRQPQESSKEACDGSKTGPRRAQDRPKTRPGHSASGSKTAPRHPKTA